MSVLSRSKDGEGHGDAGLAGGVQRPSRRRAGQFLRPRKVWNNRRSLVTRIQRRMIDAQGFRPNVGIVIANDDGRLLWARRVGGRDAWQFPQGGIQEGESAEDALYRELSRRWAWSLMRLNSSPAPAAGCATGCPALPAQGPDSRCASARSRSGTCCACSRRTTRSAWSQRQARVRSLAVGVLLVSPQPGGVLQARGVPPGPQGAGTAARASQLQRG
jgi:hypothetical protein